MTTRDSTGDAIADAFARANSLPAGAVVAVFQRYARPLAIALAPPGPDEPRADLPSPDGARATLRLLRIRMPVDVIENDYFVLERDGQAPTAIAGPLFAAAIAALARAMAIARE